MFWLLAGEKELVNMCYREKIKRLREMFDQQWKANFCGAQPVTAAFLRNVASPEELKRAEERAWKKYLEMYL